MKSRFNLFSTASLAMAGLTGLLSNIPSLAQADIMCANESSKTFHIGSTVKFTWNDTQSVQIDTFNLDLYCVQNGALIQNIATLNTTSLPTVSWLATSSLTSLAANCTLNQFRAAFDWTYSDPNTGALTQGSTSCDPILLIGAGAVVSPGSATAPSDPGFTDDPTGDVVVTDKTKSIVIGVGCAFGFLILAGFVGFYYIRYSNKRAAEEQINKKLREPTQTGPLFPPTDRKNNGGSSRYNELASITTSGSIASPSMMGNKTEMSELHAGRSPALGSRSPTPIAAAHVKMTPTLSNLTVPQSYNNNARPGSLLTSPFVPVEETRNPFEQRSSQQYEHELQMQQQHQLYTQHHQQQQQQQQQQQMYDNYNY